MNSYQKKIWETYLKEKKHKEERGEKETRSASEIYEHAKKIVDLPSSLSSWNNEFNDIHNTYMSFAYDKDGNAKSGYIDVSAAGSDYGERLKKLEAQRSEYLDLINNSKYMFDSDWADKTIELLSDASLSDGISSIGSIYDHYSNYKNEEEYNKANMGWLNTKDAEYNANTVSKRKAQYQSNIDRIAEIESMLPKYADSFLPNFVENMMLSGYEESLRNELEARKAENLQYERTQKTLDDYWKPVTDDFLANAAFRDYNNASREEMWKHDMSASEISATLNSGGYEDDEGNIRNSNGEIVYAAGSTPIVEDKLGLFLSATDEDITQAYNDISASNGNYRPTWANYIAEGDNKSWRELTEDEINIYYDLMKTDGQEAAYRYLDAMTTELNRRATNKRTEEINQASGWEQFGLNLWSIPQSVLGGSIAFVDDAINMMRGENVNPYSRLHAAQNEASAIRSKTAMDIDKLTGGAAIPFIDFSLGDAYQALMSGADSLAGSALGGTAYGVLMGMGSASSTAKDLYEKGASTKQIITGSLLAGAAEMVFEKYSIDKLVNSDDPTKIIKNMLTQAGVEASEEMATEIANTITNYLVMGSQSDWEDIGTFVKGVVNAGLGGAISGGAMSGVYSSIQKGIQNSKVKEYGQSIIDAGGVEALQKQASGLFDYKSVKKLSDKIAKKVSAKNVGKLANAVEIIYKGKSSQAAITELESNGLSKVEAHKVADFVDKVSKGYEATEQEIAEIEKISDKLPDAPEIEETKYSETKTQVNDLSDTPQIKAKQVSSGIIDASMRGKATIISSDGEEGNVTVKKVASVDNGKIMLELDNRETVNYSDVYFNSADEGLLYETIVNLGLNAQDANAFIESYFVNNNIPAQNYALGFSEAYKYGRYSYPKNQMSKNGMSAVLSESQRNFAYEIGKAEGDRVTSEKQKAIDAKKETSKQNKAEKKSGKVYYDGVKKAGLSERQKTSVKGLEVIAYALGVNIHLYESIPNTDGKLTYTMKDGTVTSANGWFDTKTGDIYIDINAGYRGKGVMLFTAAHELTHFIKKWSPAKFKILADFLIEQYGEKGVSVEELVQRQIDKAKRNGRDIDYDTAYEEVIADSCESLLSDGDVIRKLGELKARDKSLFEKIKSFITELIAKIKKAYSGLDPDSLEGQYVKEMVDAAENLKELFTDALIDAGETYSDIRYSFKEYTDKQKENWKNAKRIVLYENELQFRDFIDKSRHDNTYNKKMYFGAIPSDLAASIQSKTGINVDNFNCSLSAYEIKKIFKDHGDEVKETLRGQRAITEDDIADIPKVILSPDNIKLSDKKYDGKPVIEFSKQTNGKLTVSAVVSDKHLDLFVQTAYVGIKKGNLAMPIGEQAPINTPKASNGTVSTNRIPHFEDSVNRETIKNSLRNVEPIETADYVKMYHYFGSTKNYDIAGYILGNGMMLDFSGKHWGDNYSTSRQVDHRDIQDVLGNRGSNNGVNAMIDMIGNGNIRLMPEVGGINLAVKPNATQMSQLRGYINHFKGEVTIDIDEIGGNTIHSFDYTRGTSSTKILADIKAYFGEGIVPEQNDEGKTNIRQFLYSDRDSVYADYDKPITQSDIQKIRDIAAAHGGKRVSINDFTSEDIEATQKWAHKFYQELGTKSPFFRAWFGDWRAYDRSEINTVTVNNIDLEDVVMQNGDYRNEDTGWSIQAGRTLRSETKHYARGEKISVKALNDIQNIIRNAVLLDTEISSPDSNKKSPNTAFMHKLYAPIIYNGKPYIAKISVEEFFDEGTETVKRKGYHLAAIKIEAAGGRYIDFSTISPRSDTASIDSISDLYSLVKSFDKDFSAAPEANPFMLEEYTDENGVKRTRPKVFYHGTSSRFTSFDIGEASPREGSFFFAENREDAAAYGNHVMEVYLTADNLADYDNQPSEFYKLHNKRAQVEYLKKRGYDGWYADMDSGGWGEVSVFSPTQVKSATDNIGTFDKANDDIRYSDRDTESFSSRSLLANALEYTAQNDIERDKLKEYKSKIQRIEAAQKKLSDLRAKIKELSFAKGKKDTEAIKALQFEANQMANRINTYDRQLLNLESTKALKGVLEREKQMAYKKAEREGKEALAAYRERAVKDKRELLTRYQESRKKGIESRQKTEMRHKIKNVVNELNQYLLKGTKDKHVPIELQKTVAETLDAINMDTVGAEERIAKLKEELLKAKTPEKIQEISRKIDNIQSMGDRMDARLTALKTAYESFVNSDDPMVAKAKDEVVSNKLQSVIESVGDISLRDMSLSQLEDVYDMYKMVLTTIRNTNKAFKANKSESISILGNKAMEEVEKVGGSKDKSIMALNGVKSFAWDALKPVYAMEAIGSTTLTELYDNVRAGEDTWATDVEDARQFFRENAKKFGYFNWDGKKLYQFKTKRGETFSISLEQMMSLYAYSKRTKADDHLEKGGFVFDDAIEVTEKKKGIPIKYKVNTAKTHAISKETLADIISSLTREQRDFVDTMQDYLSTTMGEKGNEISLALYGIKLFKEKFYFPLKSAKQFMYEQNEVAGEVRIKNSGFSKETVPKANNPIILSNFMDVWSNHVNDMSMYHAFVLPLEDFNRVFNYKTPTSDLYNTESVKMYLQNAYGEQSIDYIRRLLTDLNGGARVDSTTGAMNKLIGIFKKSAVFASLSVVIQQPSAVGRAFAIIDPKYFVGKKMTKAKHKETWAEVKKYAPVAIIKEMGYFDTNMGMQTTEWIVSQEYESLPEKFKAFFKDGGYRDEILSLAPALADEVTWCGIWNAVKRETLAKHHDLTPNSEAFLKVCGERFTEVIAKTQVYDSVLSRSGMMRSKDTGMKMATAFMAEPTTSLNMLTNAIIQCKRGNKKGAAKAVGGVVASMILNSILVSFVYAARDDDDEKTYLEKYMGTLTEELFDSMNPLGLIPFVKDIVSIAQGYDVERSDMAVITDIFNAWKNLDSDNRSAYRKVEDFAGAIASLLGLPVKNIMRDARAMYNIVNGFVNGENTTGAGIANAIVEGLPFTKEKSNGQQLYDAILSGDSAQIERVKSRFKNQNAVNSAIRKALRENDSRIKEAAIAKNNGNLNEYKRIVREIVAEGHFSQDDVVAAINTEINALNKSNKGGI